MRFGVLGPLEVRADCGQLTIKGVKERRLLALLLSRANKVVPAGEIIEALWGTEPPPSAAKSVQVYVVRVRKMLARDGQAGGDTVVSRRGSGYILCAARDQVDALQFADLVARARDAAAAGAHDIAALVLREALDLWRGFPYADFQDTWFGTTEAARLSEMRLAALEDRIDAELALGRHAEVTAELETLVREHPLRERFWAQLMLALYRSGRQSDALVAFQRARSRLVEEVGVEPGPQLRAVEAGVLAHDPGLAAPEPLAAGPPELPAGLRRAGRSSPGGMRSWAVCAGCGPRRSTAAGGWCWCAGHRAVAARGLPPNSPTMRTLVVRSCTWPGSAMPRLILRAWCGRRGRGRCCWSSTTRIKVTRAWLRCWRRRP